MGYEEVGEAELVLEFGQEVEDPRPDRDVEGRDGLVQHDDPGPRDQRAGDGDALALAAGELVRVLVHVVGGEVDGGERLGHAVAAVGAGGRRVEQVEGFGDRRSTRQRGLKLP
jgi:hypothetical protein